MISDAILRPLNEGHARTIFGASHFVVAAFARFTVDELETQQPTTNICNTHTIA